jgi:hypothetical protein
MIRRGRGWRTFFRGIWEGNMGMKQWRGVTPGRTFAWNEKCNHNNSSVIRWKQTLRSSWGRYLALIVCRIGMFASKLSLYMFQPIRELCSFANRTDQFANFDHFINWPPSTRPCQTTRCNPTRERKPYNKHSVRPVVHILGILTALRTSMLHHLSSFNAIPVSLTNLSTSQCWKSAWLYTW